MTTDDQFSGGAAATSLDQIGKVFIALAQDVRKCLWDRFRGVCSAQKGKPWLETEEQNVFASAAGRRRSPCLRTPRRSISSNQAALSPSTVRAVKEESWANGTRFGLARQSTKVDLSATQINSTIA
jgi:hypothetical protein